MKLMNNNVFSGEMNNLTLAWVDFLGVRFELVGGLPPSKTS